MTLVLGYHFLSGIVVVADCRASYADGNVYDNLQKLYQVGDYTVLGFAGPLAGAAQVLEDIRRRRAEPSKRSTAVHADELERWIRGRYRRVAEKDRRNLSFLVASVAPWKARRFQLRTRIALPDIPDLSCFCLRPSRSRPGELVRDQWNDIKILGVREELHREIRGTLLDTFPDCFLRPRGEAIFRGTRALMRALAERDPAVGGLMQCAVLDANGVGWPDYDFGDIALQSREGRYVQVDKRTGQAVELLAVWEWLARRDFGPGSGESVRFTIPPAART